MSEESQATTPGDGPINIVVIPHSHWDREWYATFEEFRFYLVRFMDELLELLEDDEGFRSFLLDGQVSLLDDYLEVRPEKREDLQRLVREGRLEIGPWYVQPDEFLISAESLVRNLLLGDRAARPFGAIMKQGYVPDTFGHVSQLPQILRGFDIGTFYTMRGLAEDIEEFGTEFWWEAPDGSKVMAHFLSETYSNAAVLGSDPAKISFRHDRISEPSSYFVSYDSLFELRDNLAKRASNGTILFLNGSDHVTVQPLFSKYVFDLNQRMKDRLFNGKLGDFERLALEGNPELNTYRGELRWARYQPILKGVYSSRMYLKQENERTQQLLEGMAERAAAVVYALGGRDYSPFLRHAWKELVKNHAHDSIGGCSADAVHRQMVGRYDTARQIGQKVVDESLDYLSSLVAPDPEPGMVPLVVFNPSPWERGGSVRVDVSLETDVPLKRRIFDWIGQKELDIENSRLLAPDGTEIPFNVRGKQLHIEDALYRRKSVRRATIQFLAEEIPPLGYKVFRLVESDGGERMRLAEPPWEATLENERLRVSVEGDMTLSVFDKESGRVYSGLNLFVDEGDAGDTYNFSPPEVGRSVLSSGEDWDIEAGDDPRVLMLRGNLRLPKGLSEDRRSRSEETTRCPVNVRVRLAPGSRRVEITTEFYNRARDHRLRVAFPSGFGSVGESVAETAFGTVRRSTTPMESAGWRETDNVLFSQRRFVCVEDGEGHGLAVLNKGLPEYEATPEGIINLTLLRSVGWLSRSDLSTRRGHAGPPLPTPEAQCSGRHVFEYAVVPYSGGVEGADMFREAEEYWLPLEAWDVQRGNEAKEKSPRGAPGFFLEVGGENVVISSLKKSTDREAITIRVFNSSERETTATLNFGIPVSAAYRTNLNEEIVEEIAPRGHRLELPLGGSSIETVLVKLHRPERWAERIRRSSPGT
jgi:mannosylglycerate hydrolase